MVENVISHLQFKTKSLLLQLPINSSYTVDARITKPIIRDTLMHKDDGNIFEIFLCLPVLK